MYQAWRHGGHDPYRLFNMLDENYCPPGGGPPQPPPFPSRVRAVIYAFAEYADESEKKRGV